MTEHSCERLAGRNATNFGRVTAAISILRAEAIVGVACFYTAWLALMGVFVLEHGIVGFLWWLFLFSVCHVLLMFFVPERAR